MRGKRIVYISGKISGLADKNAPAFEAAEKMLTERGYKTINPLKLYPDGIELSWEHYMRNDIKVLMDCHMVAVLPDWEQSRGATIEVHLALDLGIPVVYADTLEPLFIDHDH